MWKSGIKTVKMFGDHWDEKYDVEICIKPGKMFGDHWDEKYDVEIWYQNRENVW